MQHEITKVQPLLDRVFCMFTMRSVLCGGSAMEVKNFVGSAEKIRMNY